MFKNYCQKYILRKNTQGFTIVELLMVIALVGTLAAALISIINPERQQQFAEDGVLRQNLSDTAQVIETYYVAERDYPDEGNVNNPLDATASTSDIAANYLEEWPSGFVYNEDGSNFSVHVEKTSETDEFFKYSSAWQEIRECGDSDGTGSINDVDHCPSL